MKGWAIAVIPLILSIGIAPALPFSEAASHFTQICIDKVWIESTKGKIACVTPSTGEKLVQKRLGNLTRRTSYGKTNGRTFRRYQND